MGKSNIVPSICTLRRPCIIIHERDEHLQIDIYQGDGNIQKIFLRDKFFHNPKPLKRLRRKTRNKIYFQNFAPPLLQRLEQSEYDF